MRAPSVEIEHGVRRVLAPNPSPMTGEGTNSYLVGGRDLVAIDPGPDDAGHLDRLVELSGGAIRYVLVTHAHEDHAPGARDLADRCGAVVLGPSPRDGFAPDAVLADGDVVAVPGWRLEVLATPGHSVDHLCYVLDPDGSPDRLGPIGPALPGGTGAGDAGSPPAPRRAALGGGRRLLFSGDHVLGGTPSVVAAPDGDMATYLDSLERLIGLDPPIDRIAPGHGPVLDEPRVVLREYVAHRLAREAQVAEALARLGPATPSELAAAVYPRGLPAGLVQASRLQVWAHLRKLGSDGRARSNDPDDRRATWEAL